MNIISNVKDSTFNDHNYADKEKFTIDQQYADDAGWIEEELR